MYIVLLLTVVLSYVDGYGGNICKVPNGDAGRCVDIIYCRPLWDIYSKKRKTHTEHLFLGQSYCGNPSSSYKVNVCCPSIFEWHNFEPSPIIYHNPFDDFDERPYIPTTTKKTTEVPVPVTVTTMPTTRLTVSVPEVDPTTNSSVDVKIAPLSLNFNNNTTSESNDNDDIDFNKLVASNNNMTCGADPSRGNRITGGNATGIDEYPWLVLLEYSGGFTNCGGSLITSRFVLTAAHCAESPRNGIPKFARLGEYNTSSFPTDIVEADGGGFEEITVTVIAVENVWKHPDYSSYQFTDNMSFPFSKNDVGLVKLAKDVEFDDFIQVICLPYKDFIPEFVDTLYLTVAGWGDERQMTELFDVKKDVKLPYVPLEKCKSTHSRLLLDTQICAGGEKDKDSCAGDSGGPLMYLLDKKYYLVGVLSYGHKNCGTEGQAGVYTNVFKYLQWISDVINGRY